MNLRDSMLLVSTTRDASQGMNGRSLDLQEKDEYVENIIADLDRLGLQHEKITYTSDYFPQARVRLDSYFCRASVLLSEVAYTRRSYKAIFRSLKFISFFKIFTKFNFVPNCPMLPQPCSSSCWPMDRPSWHVRERRLTLYEHGTVAHGPEVNVADGGVRWEVDQGQDSVRGRHACRADARGIDRRHIDLNTLSPVPWCRQRHFQHFELLELHWLCDTVSCMPHWVMLRSSLPSLLSRLTPVLDFRDLTLHRSAWRASSRSAGTVAWRRA